MVSVVRDVLRLSVHDDRRSSRWVVRDPSDPTPKRQARKRDESETRVSFACPLLIGALRHIASQCRAVMLHGHRLGVVEHVHITHAIIRLMSLHLFMQRPAAHDLLCDLSLQRERRASNLPFSVFVRNPLR
jgi:hypothetical protein